MLYGEIVAIYCENHIEDIDKLCRQSAEFLVKRGSTYSYHSALKG
jgi:hypothetical protein